MFAVSKEQIIFGGNYYTDYFPPTKSWVIWDKRCNDNIRNDFPDCELAYCSTGVARVFHYYYNGMLQGDMKHKDERFHPCLPANEKVYFNNNWVEIKDVQIGDKNAYGTVIDMTTHTAERLVKICVNSEETTATYNHPFLILRENALWWVEAEYIREGDYILQLCENINLQPRATKDTALTRTERKFWNTEKYGKSITEKYPKECTYTIKTETGLIMTFQICNLLRPLNTNGYTKVANLLMANGTSLVPYVENTKNATRIIGILAEGGLTEQSARNAILKNQLPCVEFLLARVGCVKIIERKTEVINLSIDGIPAFDTKVGVSHNTQKPSQLMTALINYYTKPNDLILDPFMGSFTTAISCHRTGRRFVGAEISKDYFDKGYKRYNDEIAQINIFD